jgi:hypothetical protein
MSTTQEQLDLAALQVDAARVIYDASMAILRAIDPDNYETIEEYQAAYDAAYAQVVIDLASYNAALLNYNILAADFDNSGGSAGPHISAVVEDLTPQLGGMLDVNGFSIGTGIDELISFVEIPSAINHLVVTNAAATGAPKLSVNGDDVNIDLELEAVGTGVVRSLDTFDVVGDITVSGTVDGIDIFTDVTANNAKVTNQNHTGDVTGDTTLTISSGAVTLAKMADMATDSFLGRDTVGTGSPEVLSATTARSILNVEDGANNYSHPNHTGDVTSTGDGATVIANSAVTLPKMADVATATFLGRNTTGTGAPEVLNIATAKALLDLSGTNTGDDPGVTSVTGGVGIDSSGGSTPDITLDLSELSVTTMVGTDWIAFDDAGVSSKALISGIPLSIFNNDSGWTSNAGTVTDVTGGTGVSSTGGATPDIALTVDELAEKAGALVGADRLVGTSGTTNFAETISNIPLSIFNNDAGWTAGGGVSDVTGGTGIDSTGGSTPDISLNLSELSVTTMVAGDWIAFDDAGTSSKALISAIPLSIFNNDSGWTSNVGTVTQVDGGAGLTGSVTSSGSLAVGAGTGVTVNADDVAIGQDVATSASVTFGNVTLGTGGALRTSTTDTNTLLLQAYDVDGTAYTTFATLTAGNTPTMSLSGAVTGVTQAQGTNDTRLATTAFVVAEVATENTLAELNDTDITAPADGAFIIYDTGTATWRDFTLSGDLNVDDSGNATIPADTVTMDQIVDIATDTFLGRVTAATGTVEVLTNAQAKTALDLSGTNTGDDPGVTSVTGGTGIDSSGGDTPDISLNLSELSVTTMVAGDWIAFDDAGTSSKALISAIPLSIFNNDSGWTSNAGTVTDVTGGTGVSSTGGATPSIALTVDELAEKTGNLVGTDRLTGTSGTTNFSETISAIPLSIFSNDIQQRFRMDHQYGNSYPSRWWGWFNRISNNLWKFSSWCGNWCYRKC